jgi:hypothetical protein
MGPVIKRDATNQNEQSDMTPVPPPLPSPRKLAKPSLLVIVAVFATGLAVFLAVRMLVRAGASDAREPKSEPGVSYKNDRVTRVPWSIHVLKIDRSRKDLTFFSAHARGKVLGVSLIADQARELARWKLRAERAEALVELQKKLAALLGTPLTTENS